jgi:hypothetical protein
MINSFQKHKLPHSTDGNGPTYPVVTEQDQSQTTTTLQPPASESRADGAVDQSITPTSTKTGVIEGHFAVNVGYLC